MKQHLLSHRMSVYVFNSMYSLLFANLTSKAGYIKVFSSKTNSKIGYVSQTWNTYNTYVFHVLVMPSFKSMFYPAGTLSHPTPHKH